VASLVAVDDASDPRLADFVALTDVRLRRSLESVHGLFVAEGEKVIRRAVRAGYQVRSLLVTPDRLAGLAELAGSCPAPVYVVPDPAGGRPALTATRSSAAPARRRGPPAEKISVPAAGGARRPVKTRSRKTVPDRNTSSWAASGAVMAPDSPRGTR